MSFKQDPLHALQTILRTKGMKYLADEYKIEIKQHPEYPNLYQFKYNQIESPLGKLEVQACRGIILNQDNGWKPVCHSFNKFFNYSEINASEINWKNCNVYEKLDGSMIQLFYYADKWQIATSGSPSGQGNVGDFNFTFKELFWNTWEELGYKLPHLQVSQQYTYTFELCTKYNRIVVEHTKPRIVLIGIRNVKFNYEVPVYQIENWEVVKKYDFNNITEILSYLVATDPYKQEGFVVMDNHYNRNKIKSEQYIRIHHLISAMSKRNILETIRRGEEQEILVHFPQWQKEFSDTKEKYNSLAFQIEKTYNEIKGIKNQKDFAMKAKEYKYSGCLFNLHNGKSTSIKQFLAEIHIKNLEEWIETIDKEAQ